MDRRERTHGTRGGNYPAVSPGERNSRLYKITAGAAYQDACLPPSNAVIDNEQSLLHPHGWTCPRRSHGSGLFYTRLSRNDCPRECRRVSAKSVHATTACGGHSQLTRSPCLDYLAR